MITDPVPAKGSRRKEYKLSDALRCLPVPADGRFQAIAIETSLSSGSTASVRSACKSFLEEAARFNSVPAPGARVLAARPLEVYETGAMELFDDYDLKMQVIRVWTRAAVRRQVTSFGTFFSTLCHEFCHHLDMHLLGLPSSWRTCGIYLRTAVFYHHCRGTPPRALV